MLSRKLLSRPSILSLQSTCTHVLHLPHQNDDNRWRAVDIRRSSSFVQSVKNAAHKGKAIYLRFLEKRFPTIYRYQMQVLNGALDVKEDIFTWARMVGEMKTGKKLSSYSKKELMAYQEISQQKIKLVPVVVIIALPFSAMFLPLLFAWPGLFLTSHFMSDAQRTSVELDKLEHKLTYCERVLDDFSLRVNKISSYKRSRKAAEEIINKIENGMTIRPKDVINIAELFEDRKYSMHNIPYRYRMHLAHCNELRIKNMTRDTQIQFLLDKALEKNPPSVLTDSELKWFCFKHGVNPTEMSRTEQVNFINTWTGFSKLVNETHMPLLLHGVVFLGYNHPSNTKLREKLKLKWKRKF
uniref:Uncharacterized protein LOC111127084 n=1 Tax=Crassostrea virginica TaxID=6565 RepID=A0A8B8DJC1_CRAVI|nr:uncharacterized protein LOC111127084 [Crassostrea virginica]